MTMLLAAPPRALGLAFGLALLLLPNCCLTMRHASAAVTAPICRALR